MKKWDSQETAYLTQNYPDHSMDTLQLHLNRSKYSIEEKVRKLKLKKSHTYKSVQNYPVLKLQLKQEIYGETDPICCGILLLIYPCFKLCKYCNKPFIPTYISQKHCCDSHRKYYRSENQTQKRFSLRHKQTVTTYIDCHGNIRFEKSTHQLLGSSRCDLGPHTTQNWELEHTKIKNCMKQLKIST